MSDSSLEIIDWSDSGNEQTGHSFVTVADLPLAKSLSRSLNEYYGTDHKVPSPDVKDDPPSDDAKNTVTWLEMSSAEAEINLHVAINTDASPTAEDCLQVSMVISDTSTHHGEDENSPSDMFLSCPTESGEGSGGDDTNQAMSSDTVGKRKIPFRRYTKTDYSSDSGSEGLNDICKIRRGFLANSYSEMVTRRIRRVSEYRQKGQGMNSKKSPLSKLKALDSCSILTRDSPHELSTVNWTKWQVSSLSNELLTGGRILQNLRLMRSPESFRLHINSPLRTTRLNHGFFSWLGNCYCLQAFARHAKKTLNAIITTLDPEMANYIRIEPDMSAFVITMDSNVSAAIHKAFRAVFPHVPHLDVQNVAVERPCIPAEPVGFDSGLLCAEYKINFARQRQLVPHNSLVISVSPVLVEITPRRWHSCACILLDDPDMKLTLNVFTQTTPVPNEYVTQASLRTPENCRNKDLGLTTSIGEIMNILSGIPKQDWQKVTSEVSLYTSIESAAKTLVGMYKRYLEGWSGHSHSC